MDREHPLLGRRGAASVAAIAAAAAVAGACDGGGSIGRSPGNDWSWSDLGGPDAPTPDLVANHETLVVAGDILLLGTADGVWRRPLTDVADWQRSGLAGKAIHALTATADGARLVAAGYDAEDAAGPTAWYSTTGGLDWIAASAWPKGAPGSAAPGQSFRFASLEADPLDADVVYGGLDADSIAVTVDGGATWILTDGADEPSFGYPCVAHRPRGALVLLQGCELPLDAAWVGARDILATDRFRLPGFRYLYGYPNADELGNRRINSIVAPPARADRVLVGVEGGLVELTSKDGAWTDRTNVAARWIFRSNGESSDVPYAYIRAIAPLGGDGRRVLFGGTVNGVNDVLSLFESNGGDIAWRVDSPFELEDPRVEQAVRLGESDVLLVISTVTDDEERTSKVYRLRRP
ncbi:MAG TPA: hypothetical protein VF339_11130 [Gammaproteobacteria bacterium]